MVKSKSGKSDDRNLKMTGFALGLGFGIAGLFLLVYLIGGYLAFFPFILLAPVVVGPVVGVLLARVNAIPRIHPVPMFAFALVTACAPYLAGLIEVRSRDNPFPIPSNAEVIKLTNSPMGGRVVFLESSAEVPAFFDQLVAAANSAGWQCRTCRFYSSTETGHATFKRKSALFEESHGSLGLEVWPGVEGHYGSPPSELTQARVVHGLRTKSPVYAFLAISFLFLVTVVLHLFLRPSG